MRTERREQKKKRLLPPSLTLSSNSGPDSATPGYFNFHGEKKKKEEKEQKRPFGVSHLKSVQLLWGVSNRTQCYQAIYFRGTVEPSDEGNFGLTRPKPNRGFASPTAAQQAQYQLVHVWFHKRTDRITYILLFGQKSGYFT